MDIQTVYEIQRIKQVVTNTEIRKRVIRSPKDGAEVAREFIGDEDREVFFVAALNTKNEIVAVHRCHIGSINASVVTPREVFKVAILNNSASLLCFHNHPSGGNPKPSQEDIHVTRRLCEAGKMIGIEVLDYVIVGGNSNRFFSMKEKGYV